MAASLSLTLILTLCALASLDFSNAYPSYAPTTDQACPAVLLRQSSPAPNNTLNSNEVQYLADRRGLFPDAWRDWVGDGTQLGYDLDKLKMTAYDPSGLPVIGIAMSGGGHRAAQTGAGILSALDARNTTAKTKGTGGLLQVSSYLTGVSGGSWLVSSMLFNEFPDIRDLVLGNTDTGGSLNGWLLERDLLQPNPNSTDPQNAHYYADIVRKVVDKGQTGIDISLTDVLSGGLAYHFLSGLGDPNSTDTITTEENFFTNDTSHGTGIIWSNMINIPTFQKREFPLPIVAAAARTPAPSNASQGALSSTQFEFTPWEFGSYDPDLSAFVDIQFMGTQLINGEPANASACVTGFDQTSFIFGTSGSLFHRPGQITDFLGEVLNVVLASFVPIHAGDVGNYPNPFQGINPNVYQDSQSTILELVDGGDAGEIVPLAPLLVKLRQLDVIVAADSSSDDDDHWPEGFTLYATRNRTQQVTTSVVQEFPPIPDIQADFGRLGLNRRPTFFGCDPKESPAEFPLLVYIPNAPPVDGSDPVTNFATERSQFQPGHTSLILDQGQSSGFSGFLAGQLGADDGFGTCLQCAAVDRARLKTNPITPRSDICSKCFQKYCFDPEHPPPEGQIVGRKLQFKEPGPFGPT